MTTNAYIYANYSKYSKSNTLCLLFFSYTRKYWYVVKNWEVPGFLVWGIVKRKAGCSELEFENKDAEYVVIAQPAHYELWCICRK